MEYKDEVEYETFERVYDPDQDEHYLKTETKTKNKAKTEIKFEEGV